MGGGDDARDDAQRVDAIQPGTRCGERPRGDEHLGADLHRRRRVARQVGLRATGVAGGYVLEPDAVGRGAADANRQDRVRGVGRGDTGRHHELGGARGVHRGRHAVERHRVVRRGRAEAGALDSNSGAGRAPRRGHRRDHRPDAAGHAHATRRSGGACGPRGPRSARRSSGPGGAHHAHAVVARWARRPGRPSGSRWTRRTSFSGLSGASGYSDDQREAAAHRTMIHVSDSSAPCPGAGGAAGSIRETAIREPGARSRRARSQAPSTPPQSCRPVAPPTSALGCAHFVFVERRWWSGRCAAVAEIAPRRSEKAPEPRTSPYGISACTLATWAAAPGGV